MLPFSREAFFEVFAHYNADLAAGSRKRRHRHRSPGWSGNLDLGEHRPRHRQCRHPDPGQLARHRLPPPAIQLPAAHLMSLAGRPDRSARAKCIAQHRQLLLHRLAPTARHAANDLDPSSHTTSRMTTRRVHFDIVRHRLSSTSGHQPIIATTRKTASTPRLRRSSERQQLSPHSEAGGFRSTPAQHLHDTTRSWRIVE
jgi:hypothetical protein